MKVDISRTEKLCFKLENRQMFGIAREELGLGRISATVFEGNRASERVLEKNGFRMEETKTGAFVKGGKAMDVRVYCLNR